MADKVQLKDSELTNRTGREILFSLLTAASELNLSFACWRLPKLKDFHILIDFSSNPQKQKAQLERSTQGFLIQPFLQENIEDTIFLKADLLYSSADKDITIKSDTINPILKEKFFKVFYEKLKTGNYNLSLPVLNSQDHFQNTKEHYIKLVELGKKAILENKFKKIVLSRNKAIDLLSTPDISKLLQKVAEEYASAFVTLIHTPETGTWMTATPEILASIDKEGTFRTIALAGTQQLKEGENIERAVWTQKEIEEQALVGRYIINCFKKIRLREYEEDGPRTIQSGNLLHLRTDYSVNTKELNFPELGSVMLELLHPTSAVCGMPKEITLEFIKEHEGLERKLFSGYLGPVNIEDESHIFVNLRCANLFANKVVVYAGAGVTKDSEPEKEYRETELKMEAVGRFFN